MLDTLLEIDTSVTWRTLVEAIDSPAVVAACNSSTIVQEVMPTESNAGNYWIWYYVHPHMQNILYLYIFSQACAYTVGHGCTVSCN